MFCLRVASLVAKWWWGERDKKTNAKKKKMCKGPQLAGPFRLTNGNKKRWGLKEAGRGARWGTVRKKNEHSLFASKQGGRGRGGGGYGAGRERTPARLEREKKGGGTPGRVR